MSSEKPTVIELTVLTGHSLRLGLIVLGLALAEVLWPLVFSADELFVAPNNAPTLRTTSPLAHGRRLRKETR